MPILLGLTAALGWGASDYFGGDATRSRTPVLVVVALAELLGALMLAPILVARGTPPPADPRLLLAALAGLAVTAELGLIYRALSQGWAFITAPTGALGAAGAVTIGVIGGDPLDAVVVIGLVIALVGGGISAWSSPRTSSRSAGGAGHAAVICLGAAAAVAITLSSLHAAGRVDPTWAAVTEHLTTGLSAGLVACLATRRPLRKMLPGRALVPVLALVAFTGTAGDLAYTAASHLGALTVVSAVSSLYPAATIALARLLRDQRATVLQIVGIGLALGGATVLGAAAP